MARIVSLFILLLVASAEGFDLRQIEQRAGSWARVEDFLDWVKQESPESLSHFTLIRNSQSQQQSSPDYPRALVFGRAARLVFTFNGHASHRGYRTVELFQFDPTSATYDFRQIDFSGKSGVLSVSNPTSCQGCHSARPRPIWDAYDRWPTAYGAFDDSIINFGSLISSGSNSEYFVAQTQQFFEFAGFQSIAGDHSRYGFLDFPEGSPVSPYSIREKGESHRLRPNGRLTALLVRQQAQRLASLIHGHRQSARLEAPLLAVLIGCPGAKTGVWAAEPLLHQLGITKDDWNLSLAPSNWGYPEGSRDLSDFVASALYEKLRAIRPGLPPFRPIGEVGYVQKLFFDVPDVDYEDGARAIELPSACEALRS